MPLIFTNKARGNQTSARVVHNFSFLDISDVSDPKSHIRDYGISADMRSNGTFGVDEILYREDGFALFPSIAPTTLRKWVAPKDKAFALCIVADWSQIAALTLGDGGNGFFIAPNGAFASANGLNQSVAGNSTIVGTANINEIGGIIIYGAKNGVMRYKTFVPGNAIITVGDVTLPNVDIELGNNISAFGGVNYLGGVLFAYGASFSHGMADDILTQYTNDTIAKIIRTPAAIDGLGF